jgi:hypothetical protein
MKKLITVALLLASFLSFSQVQKGDKEIGVFGNFNAPTEGGGGSGAISVMLNQYLTKSLSLGISTTMSFYSAPDPATGDNELKITPFIGGFVTYNFLTANGKLMPYLGLEYTFSWIETTEAHTLPAPPYVYYIDVLEDLHFVGGKGGMKIFITEMVNFDINLKYQTLISGPEGYNAGNIGVNFGIGIILPRKK